MSATHPAADGATAAATATAASGAAPRPAAPVSIPALEAEITARRDRLAKTIDELTQRVSP
jgi:hypothetical protein